MLSNIIDIIHKRVPLVRIHEDAFRRRLEVQLGAALPKLAEADVGRTSNIRNIGAERVELIAVELDRLLYLKIILITTFAIAGKLSHT